MTSLAFCPFHLDPRCDLFVSGSKDKSVRVWNASLGRCVATSTTHTSAVTKVVWTPRNFVLSCSEDRTIHVWSAKLSFIRKLGQHSHWVNCMSLSTEYLIRNSYFELPDMTAVAAVAAVAAVEALSSAQKAAKMQELFRKFYREKGAEYLVTGSDDNTINLFSLGQARATRPESAPEPAPLPALAKRNDSGARLRETRAACKFRFTESAEQQAETSQSFGLVRRYTGHSRPVNHVQFAPNGFLFVSASFDKSLRVWNVAQSGCLAVLRGHVAAVYR